MRDSENAALPVAVVGAGPQGLAAAAHLLERGLAPLVFESGPHAGAAVREWGHVRLFSAWPELVDAASARLLEPTGWTAPTSGYPTGAEWVRDYLAPLGTAIEHAHPGALQYGQRVTAISRRGRDRLVDADRAKAPFTIHTVDGAGAERRIEARAVVDASGTWRSPNPAGADGVPAVGERAAGDPIGHHVPDRERPDRWAGRHTVVLGSGDSAFTAIGELLAIAREHGGTTVTWAIRRPVGSGTFGGGAADELPRRGALGQQTKEAVESGAVTLVEGFRLAQVRVDGGRAELVGEDDRPLDPADAVVALTGFRPDLSFLSELRLDLDPTLEAPRRVAAEVDPNLHSCGTVQATGATDLAQPEPDFYPVGMKSYGRAPTFLAMTGYEQVRSVVAQLAGDHEAAARVELSLPDTGVCGGAGLYDAEASQVGAGGCCG